MSLQSHAVSVNYHLDRTCMESCMAGLDFSTLETTIVPVYNLPTSWQLLVLGAIFVWLILAQLTTFTKHVRALVQPFVLRHVESEVPVILAIQKCRHPQLDSFMGILATSVSVEFYALVLPMLFWHGQAKLARQLTLLMATCLYLGNCLKDTVCAPRPPSPVCRVVSSGTEETSSAEYGLPSSHTINIICFAGYVLHYLADQEVEFGTFVTIASLFTIITSLVIYGRLYLGMHSPIDVLAGCAIGASLLLGWCNIDEYLDNFITSGENVVSFWAAISILALYAYPIPESPTPSFGDHTAFSGVTFGIVTGVRRTFPLYHAASASTLSLAPDVVLKTALGIVTIVVAKEGSKYLATFFLPYICYFLEPLLGFRFQSSSYVKSMRKGVQDDVPTPVETRKFGGVLKPFYRDDELMDVDTGIRFVQYATLGWAVVELVPSIFSRLAL